MAKDGSLLLSVDAGSNHMGLSLWRDDKFIRSGVVHAKNQKDDYSIRLKTLREGFDNWLLADNETDSQNITCVISEAVKMPLVTIPLGIVFLHSKVHCAFKQHHMVYPSEWKKWARANGATGEFKKIKGAAALKQVGWPHKVDSDDEADSILIALFYFSKQWEL